MDLVTAPHREVWTFIGRSPDGSKYWWRREGMQSGRIHIHEIDVAVFWPAPKPVEPQQTARVGGILQALLDRLFGIPRPVTADDYALAGGKGAE